MKTCIFRQVLSKFPGGFLHGTPRFPLVSTGFPVSIGFHGVSCFQWFPRGFHSGIWAVSALHGMETTGELGQGLPTWKIKGNRK